MVDQLAVLSAAVLIGVGVVIFNSTRVDVASESDTREVRLDERTNLMIKTKKVWLTGGNHSAKCCGHFHRWPFESLNHVVERALRHYHKGGKKHYHSLDEAVRWTNLRLGRLDKAAKA